MSVSPAMSIHESTFSQSDTTDAILVVEGKKLHVNKAFLSFHSDFFKTLFNADFMEKSMPEIPIKDVKFEDFATLLSLLYPCPIKPRKENAERLLELADRFLLPAAKCHVEYFIVSTDLKANKKLELAGTYELENLLSHALKLYKTKEDLVPMKEYLGFSANVKVNIFDRLVELNMISNNDNVSARDSVGWRKMAGITVRSREGGDTQENFRPRDGRY